MICQCRDMSIFWFGSSKILCKILWIVILCGNTEKLKTFGCFFQKNIFSSKVEFTQWNDQKFDLHLREKILDFYVDPGEIWYVKLGVNVWFEQNGKSEFQRPVLVVSRIGMLFFILPLSTKNKINKFYYSLTFVHFDKPSLVVLSQARVIDKRRFVNAIGMVSDEELLVIKKLLRDLYLPGA